MDRGLGVASRIVGKLTARRVATIRPPNGRKAGVVADGGNLYLQVSTGRHGNISRSWVFRYELAGQRREMGLGPIHTLNLRKARLRARELREQLLNNVDPLDERQKARQALITERAKTVTFEKTATMYFDLHADSWGTRHRAQWINSLRQHVFPHLGKLAPAAIDSAMVLKFIQPLWLTKTKTAARVLNRIETVLDFATTSGLRSGDNPARQTQTALPKPGKISTVNSFAALPYDEMAALMQKLATRDEFATTALRFLILTTARSGEVRGACWPEIHFDKRLWIVPGSRMKSGREHRVPLSDAALSILIPFLHQSEQTM
jgi:hypothetical protein